MNINHEIKESAITRPSEEKEQQLREKYAQSPEQVDRENRESFQSLDQAVGETADVSPDQRTLRKMANTDVDNFLDSKNKERR